jgi:glycine oxidase
LTPWVGSNVRSAILSTIEPQVDAYPLTMATAEASEYYGAKIISAEAKNLVTAGSRITGVRLHNGTKLSADGVVLAMGPWSHVLSTWIGFDIPIKPQKGQIIYLDSPHKHPEYALIHNDSYILPKLSGKLFAGTTWEDVGFSTNTTQQGQAQIIKNTLYMSPLSQETSVITSSACLRPLSEDNYPFIGQLPAWDNLYIAAGHGPEGILLSPATGKYLSEIIINKSSSYDISPFSPNRLAL